MKQRIKHCNVCNVDFSTMLFRLAKYNSFWLNPQNLPKSSNFRKFGSLNAFQQDDDCLILDIECEVTFEIKTKYKEAITAIDKFQQENHDLRWNLSIYWCYN